MRTHQDAKTMARALRIGLAERQIDVSHSTCLELVARQFDLPDWNTLSARMDARVPQMKAPIPILRSFSREKTTEFYMDFLGFSLEWEHRFAIDAPLYMQVSRGETVLHISEHHGDASPGAAIFVWMRGVKAFHAELIAKDYAYNRPGLERMPWNAQAVTVKDPFGNRLTFNEHETEKDRRR